MKKLLTLPLIALSCAALAQDVKYKALVTVDDGAVFTVQETFTVPPATEFTRIYGSVFTSALGFEENDNLTVSAVKADGHNADFQTAGASRDKHASVYLSGPKPASNFEIDYTANGGVRFFSNRDEIRFSPFDAQSFPAQNAELDFVLPAPAQEIKVYAGTDGDKKEIPVDIKRDGNKYSLVIDAARYANPEVVIYMPKGVFAAQSISKEVQRAMKSNKRFFAGALVLFGLLIYYIAIWLYLGVYDKKNISPSDGSKIPEDLTPGEMRFLYKKVPGQVSDRFKILSSSVLNLGVKGLASLEKKGHEFIIRRTAKTPAEQEETYLCGLLFGDKKEFSASQKTSAEMKVITRNLYKFLGNKLYPQYFADTALWSVLGYLLAVCYVVWAYFFLYRSSPVYFLFLVAAAAFISVFFASLFNPFNKEGRKVMKEIESLRKFLMSSEESVAMQKSNLKMFEKYLPYAVALGVENKWCRKFSNTLRADSLAWYTSETLKNSVSPVSAISAETGSDFTNSFYYTSLKA